MKKIFIILVYFIKVISGYSYAQEDLMNLLNDDTPKKEIISATFKTTRLVIGQSIENVPSGNLNFIISHHFGKINEGSYNLWGLDQSTIRLGLEYSPTERLELGIGRSTFQKTIDGYIKFKILRQDNLSMPLSVSYFGGLAINTLKWEDPERVNYFTSRLSFVNQILISRKLNNNISIQIMPSHIHNNLVKSTIDPNDIFALGSGGRVKLSQRISVNAEYYYIITKRTRELFDNSLSLGFDIETGGHVFQLFLTNSQPLFERGFITETKGSWGKGDIYFGFNIVRTFTIIKPKNFR
jgi:hypothetical protein